jgi:formylglycine-generating enzyme required for sulfatase activity/CheY-like chemotaxis protein
MRILLVDDDPSVVQSLAAILQSLPGHDVRAATTGGQALQNAMAMGGVDLLITDVVMEPMDGFTLRDQIATRYPAARTILITGFDLSEYAEQTAGLQVLEKPIDADAFRDAIERETAPAPPPVAEERFATPVPRVVAAPTAVAQPRVAAAAPRAIAAAQPGARAAGVLQASVAPKVAAVPAAAPGVVAQPAAVPRATVPQPAAVPKTAAAVSTAPSIIGHTIGAYQILSLIGQGHWGSVYAAVQTSINRPVALKILDPTRARDESAKARFLSDARAKAHVQHPAIVAVYEAGEADGHIFYTHEFVEGRNLEELHHHGDRIDEPTALKVLKVAAEGLGYLTANKIPHSLPQPKNVYVAADGHPRLANLARQHGDDQGSVEDEIQSLGRALLSVMPAIQTVSPPFRILLGRMVKAGPQGVSSWPALLQAVKALEPKVIPVEAAKISAQDRAAIAAVDAARKSQRRSLYINIASMVSLVLVAGIVIWRTLFAGDTSVREEMVRIPVGPFLFGSNGELVQVPEFSIDKYEVSIGQYGEFVKYLEGHPTGEFDHPRQPKTKTVEMHKPKDWPVYYGRAAAGKPIHSVPSDLNMPTLMVDWWDAYAYAKWKGKMTGTERDLPTEQEWEKAARGGDGFIYPWGNEFDPKKLNSNGDHVASDPAAPAKIDGFNYWGPVQKQKDKSPYGVIGMAGNVAEWTSTWTPDNRFPIIKGGSFSTADARLDSRVDTAPPGTAQENIGFRTVIRSTSSK